MITDSASWVRLVIGALIVYALFQWSANELGSVRGEWGLLIGALVVIATLSCEWLLFGRSPARALRTLGFGHSRLRGVLAAMTVSVLLISVIPIFAVATATPISFRPGWFWMLPGLFAQAGIAEETLFRGFLFGRLRETRTFWRAAGLSTIPFVGAHLYLFLAMPAPVALAALLVSVVLSFPFAKLFELGGRTIWAPALLHTVVQGGLKVVDVAADATAPLTAMWMGASVVVALPILAVGIGPQTRSGRAGSNVPP